MTTPRRPLNSFRPLLLILAALAAPATASDACSTRAIVTAAEVSVSAGSSFRTESFFHGTDSAAIQHVYDQPQWIVVEGPQSWIRAGEEARLGSGFHKLFALSHQYHAMLAHFEDFLAGAPVAQTVTFAGREARAAGGEFIYGGHLSLVAGASAARPLGIRQAVPDGPVIEAEFLDWRKHNGTDLPHHVRIDDGERVFDYRYTSIETMERSPLWYFEAVPAPDIDAVQLYRLHRSLLAAHCLGDAELIARLSTPEVLLATRGELVTATRDEVLAQFRSLVGRLDYTAYTDLRPPVITVAESGDLAWLGVNVRLQATALASQERIDQQWAWVMLARKSQGQWLHAGNASSAAPAGR